MENEKLTPEFVEDYYLRSRAKFNEALKTCGELKRYYLIADTTVCLQFAGEALVPLLCPALAHLEIPATNVVDFTVKIWDSQSSGVKMLPPPCPHKNFTHRGDIYGAPTENILMAYHSPEAAFNLFHKQKKEAIHWVQNSAKFHYWVTSSPLRSIFGWWMEQNNGQLLHAAAVGTKNGAVLISGRGGLGKSSTAVKALDAGMLYLADDYLIIRNNPEPRVYSLYSTAKIHRQELELYPRLKPALASFINAGQEKGVYFLSSNFKEQIRRSLPIVGVFTPQVVDRENSTLATVSGSDMLQAMAFTTTTQIPHSGEYTQSFLKELTRKVPAAKLLLGRNNLTLTNLLTNVCTNPDRYLSQVKHEPIAKKWPLITVIIPTYNGAKFIAQAINNVFKQNYPSLELIVIDDGSTDNTEEIVNSLLVNLLYVKQANKGPAAARNRGLKNANGSLIAFLDVDDHWPNNFLNRYSEELMANPNIMVMRGFGQLFRYTQKGTKEFLGNPAESYLHYIGAALYRKEAFEVVGLFDDDMMYGEDDDWHIRATEKNLSIRRKEEVSLLVQRHSSNMTLQKKMLSSARLKVFKKKLNRLPKNDSVSELLLNPNYAAPNYARHPISFVINYQLYSEINLQAVVTKAEEFYPFIHFLIISEQEEIIELSSKLPFKQVKANNAVAGYNAAIEESQTELLYFYNPNCELQSEVLKRLAGILIRRSELHFVLTFAKGNESSFPQPILDPCLGLFERSYLLKNNSLQEMKTSITWLDFFYRLREEGAMFSFIKSGGACYLPEQPSAEAIDCLHKNANSRIKLRGIKPKYPRIHKGPELMKFLQVGSL
jgi:glycosyltransferase involved in cell wall biosynthesis